jgi:hypothetical protein
VAPNYEHGLERMSADRKLVFFPGYGGGENIRKMLTSVLYEIGMKHALEVITRKGVIRSGGLRGGTATSNTVQMLIVWHLNPLFRLIQ